MASSTHEWDLAVADWSIALRAAGRASSTIRAYQDRLGQLSKWATRRLLGPWHITHEELLSFLGSDGWAHETRRGMRNAIVSFYRWAFGSKRLPANIAEAIPPIRPSGNSRRPAPLDAIQEAWERGDERQRLILRLAAELGLRRAEIAVIHQRDLMKDLHGWSLLVHGKGERNRVLPLEPGMSIAIRQATTANGGYAFPGDDNGHLSPRWVGKLISRILPRDITLHQLRHRFATVAHQATGDVRLVQAMLGHASLATTQRYIDMHSDHLRSGIVQAHASLRITKLPHFDNAVAPLPDPPHGAAHLDHRSGAVPRITAS